MKRAGPPAAALAMAAALSCPMAALAERPVPFLTGRVVDEANLLPPAVRDRIELRLRDLEAATGAQVAVLTVDSLAGDALEDYTLRVAETWKLGGKERDDGVLLLVARAERRMRLEVGYGLEDRLTDLQSGRILDEVIGPRFKAGEFGAGIEEGVKAIERVVHGQQLPAPAAGGQVGGGQLVVSGPGGRPLRWQDRVVFGLVFVLVIGTFSALALFLPNPVSWVLYVFLMPFHCMFPMVFLTPGGGLVWLGLWAAGYPVARRLLGRSAWGARARAFFNVPGRGLAGGSSAAAGSGWSLGSGSSWSSGSSSGGSSFSGGGGSFGGGGASSSW